MLGGVFHMNNPSTSFSTQQRKSAVEALSTYKGRPFVKHEWEELVAFLSNSDDPDLRERMRREIEAIKELNPFFRLS
jgi:hypothetical protein